MKIIAIDPGTTESAFVALDGYDIVDHGILNNDDLLRDIHPMSNLYDRLVIEMIASYGMAVGKSTFETCVWIGRFIQKWESDGGNCNLVFRKEIKMHLCGSMRAKDANIRQAILDRYDPTGGGKTPQVGTQAHPGPLYGIKSHEWAAMAVGLYWMDVNGKDKQ